MGTQLVHVKMSSEVQLVVVFNGPVYIIMFERLVSGLNEHSPALL